MIFPKPFKYYPSKHRSLALFEYFHSRSQSLLLRTTTSDHSRKSNETSLIKSSKNQGSSNEVSHIASEEVFKRMSESASKSNKISYFVEEKDKEVVNSLKVGNIFYPYKDPFERTKSVLLEDVKCGMKLLAQKISGFDLGYKEIEYFPRYTDILVIGNGVLGLAIAYEIKKMFPYGPHVILLDRNCDIPHKSTNLGQGLIWQQCFTLEEEIEMTKYCVEFLNQFKKHTEVQGRPLINLPYEPMGSLHLAEESNAELWQIRSEVMKKYQVKHQLLSNASLKSRFPWLNSDDVVFGSLGLCHEGLIDPWSFINGLKCKAVNLGVTLVTAEAIDFGAEKNEISNVVCRLPDGSYNSIKFATLILATGTETLNLVKIYNDYDFSPFKLKLPLIEKRKYEYCFYNPNGPGINTPMVVDKNGIYFRREGLLGFYVVGVPTISSDDIEENDVYNIYVNKVLPFLKKRIPQYKDYKLFKGWISTYDTNTANEIGIIGSHPDDRRVFFANGFQHLGFQYVPAVSRSVVENIFYNQYMTIDMSNFHINNLYRRQHLEAERKRKEMIAAQQRVALTE